MPDNRKNMIHVAHCVGIDYNNKRSAIKSNINGKESPMDFTISDFYRKHEGGMTLIAGAGGMARTITEAGTP